MARGIRHPAGHAIKIYPLLFALACGFAVAVCGIVSGDTIYGTGYTQVKAALEGGHPLPESFGLLKFLKTTFAAIGGIPGGIFSPSLAIGAGIGANIAALFHDTTQSTQKQQDMVSY